MNFLIDLIPNRIAFKDHYVPSKDLHHLLLQVMSVMPFLTEHLFVSASGLPRHYVASCYGAACIFCFRIFTLIVVPRNSVQRRRVAVVLMSLLDFSPDICCILSILLMRSILSKILFLKLTAPTPAILKYCIKSMLLAHVMIPRSAYCACYALGRLFEKLMWLYNLH